MGLRSALAGLAGGILMTAFYVAVVAGASGSWDHLREEVADDWYLLVLVIAGITVQITLLAELHRRHRLARSAAAASGAGAGASTVGMIACCAHHLADILPFLGATGVAAFLYDYKVWFVLVGVGVNAVGVVVAARRLRRTRLPTRATDGVPATAPHSTIGATA